MIQIPPVRDPRSPRSGFTLVELLVVISIVALLVALLLPALGEARSLAKDSVCKSQLRQLAVAMVSYLNDYNLFYPHYGLQSPPEHPGDRFWHQKLKNRNYFDGFDVAFCPESTRTHSPTNSWTPRQFAFYIGGVSYGMSIAVVVNYADTSNWPFFPQQRMRQDRLGNPSETIIVVDADYYHDPPRGQWYGAYSAYPFDRSTASGGDDQQAWPRHRGSCNVWWADGHVTGVRAPDPDAPESLYTPNALSTLYGTPDYWIQD